MKHQAPSPLLSQDTKQTDIITYYHHNALTVCGSNAFLTFVNKDICKSSSVKYVYV